MTTKKTPVKKSTKKMKPGTYVQLPRKAIKYLPCGCCVFDPTVKKSSEHYEKGSRE
jgi:hypothetical protein